MHTSCRALCALRFLGLVFCFVFYLVLDFRPACAEPGAPPIKALDVAVEDFGYVDTAGEPTDQSAVHQTRLSAFMSALKRDVGEDQRYRVVPPRNEGLAPLDRNRSTGDDGPRIRIAGSIHKMSTLVQFANVTVIDAGTRRVLLERRYTFRGDNDEAWKRAEAFMARDVLAALATAAPSSVGLAVFEFELEDTTAAALPAGVVSADAAHLAEITEAVRELLAQSGRYRVIELGGTDADAVKAQPLRDCRGCEAEIALKRGADQALIGVVRRVSRTEYTIGFQVRDARSGAVIARGDSGLRMGADYSWKRGAVRLISDRLLESPSPQ
jgi:uncharacterized protein DUF2380